MAFFPIMPYYIIRHIDRTLSPNILILQWLILAVLALQDHRAGLQRLDGMPLADGDVQRDDGTARSQFDRFRALARIVIRLLDEPSPQANDRLRT